MRSVHQIRLALLLTFLVGLSAACVAQASTDGPLTNADIVKMMRAGLPESIIVREIRLAGGGLVTTPDALIHLKKQGASERILDAVLDSQGDPYAPESYAYQGVPVQYRPSRPHLPSFEADLRVKSNKHEKVSVGQNHISVQQSGVPLFSLTWKETGQGK